MTSTADRLDQNHGQVRGAVRRPNSAPPYYLGHAARLWLTVLGPQPVLGPQRRTSAARAQ
jgi:hypothetical protein